MTDPYSIRINNPPPVEPPVESEPVHLDPLVRDARAGPFSISATVLAAVAIVILVLYGLTRESSEPTTVAASPPAASAFAKPDQGNQPPQASTPAPQQGTTGQGTTDSNAPDRSRPIPQEQDPAEQNARP